MMIAIPFVLLLLYMARYYTLKHEYKELYQEYSLLTVQYWEKVTRDEEFDE